MSKHRRRVLVALIPQGDVAVKVRAVASLFGEPRSDRIPPHVTVVPPINLSGAGLAEARAILRRVASGIEPFQLGFSALASFAPAAATVHLAVADDGGHLGLLRDQVRTGPLLRDDPRPFSPHVTLVTSASDAQIDAALQVSKAREAGPGPLGPWDVDRIFLLEQMRDETGTTWQLLAEEPFGRTTIVGRGGIELLLRCVDNLEPATARLMARSGLTVPPEDLSGHDTLCVSAELPRRPGVSVGAAVGLISGQSAWLGGLVTDEGHRRLGIARQVVAQWCYQSADRGALVAICPRSIEACGEIEDPGVEVLEELGFTPVGRFLIRQLQ